MRHGVRLGLDPGDVRIGVARSDPTGYLATPVETVKRGKGDLQRIRSIVEEIASDSEVIEIVVGLPKALAGGENPATAKARDFAATVAKAVAPIRVRLVDERLTTVSAESVLREQGVKGQARRAVVDQVAATMILQYALDTERQSGLAPGELVTADARHGGGA